MTRDDAIKTIAKLRRTTPSETLKEAFLVAIRDMQEIETMENERKRERKLP